MLVTTDATTVCPLMETTLLTPSFGNRTDCPLILVVTDATTGCPDMDTIWPEIEMVLRLLTATAPDTATVSPLTLTALPDTEIIGSAATVRLFPMLTMPETDTV